MRTLLTGFGSFGAVVENPSARIAAHFERHGAPGHELTTCVLPVSYDRVEAQVPALLRDGRFDQALLMGVAQTEPALRLERVARRPTGELPADVDGQRPESIGHSPDAPTEYLTPLDLDPLAAALTTAGLPCRLSDDAGRYLCNYTYYAALHTIAAAGLPTRCFFLHVPAHEAALADPGEHPVMPLERQIEAVALILALLR